jgi:nucleoside-diphosphate-sugar epimerase
MAKYIVTGGNGFIGSALARTLRNLGHQVIVTGRKSVSSNQSDIMYSNESSVEQLCKLFEGAEAVFHLATHFSSSNSPVELEKMLESNIKFSNTVAMACRVVGVNYLINMESMSQHVEGKIGNAKNYYAFTKNIGSKSIELWSAKTTSVMNLCLFDTYGALDNRGKLIQTLLLQTATSKHLELSKGDQIVDYLYIDDVVSGIMKSLDVLKVASTEQITSCRYRLTSYRYPSLRNFIAEVEKILSREFRINWGKRPYREGEMFDNWDYPHVLPEWLPSVDLFTGMTSTAMYYDETRTTFSPE